MIESLAALNLQPILVIVAGLLAAVMGAGLLRRGRGRVADGPEREPVRPPPPPDHSSTEHKNEDADDAIEAVVEAAEAHDVHPGIVAADLDWFDGDGPGDV